MTFFGVKALLLLPVGKSNVSGTAMNRRSFIKTVTLGAASIPALGLPRFLQAQTQPAPASPPYAPRLVTTPFDGPAGAWTLVVLPDTQNYSQAYPEVFARQCEWIVAHQKAHNILFVAHEGDITNDNTPQQWENARKALSILNNAQIPYSLITGNHDTGPTGQLCADRSTLLNDYFTERDFAASPASGLFEPGKLQNNWHHFDTPTGKFLVVGTEFAPRDVAVNWAKDIIAKNADRKAILLTHCYLYSDSTRYDWQKYQKEQKWSPKNREGLIQDGNVNDGQDMWSKIIAPSSNVLFTMNGHVLNNGTGYLATKAEDGHTVHQILANYQAAVEIDDGAGGIPYSQRPVGAKPSNRAFGGGGFLRLMQFHPDGKTVAVKTYSPWYDRWLTQPDQQFGITLSEVTA
jgi:Calcineurin-like phosphoesterase